jgi:tetratricopeptide (TPR) repeat protein
MSTTNTPTKQQVREELEKVIRSKEFEGRQVLRQLLEHIVGYSLDGEERSGKEVAIVVFPASDPDSTNVKANVFSVRDKLASYFAGDGAADLVRIDLPMGRTYRATFSYKYNLEAVRLYEKGLGLLGMDGHAGRLHAKQCFDLAIRADANMSAAHLAKLQIAIIDYLLENALGTKRLPRPSVPRPFEGELDAMKANPGSWLAWCLHGTARMLGGQLEEATKAFEKALSLDLEKTNANICFAFYVLLTGRREEALRLSALWDKSSVDGGELVARGLFFYLAGERESAIEALQSFRIEQGEMITVNLLLQGLVNLEADRYHWEFAQEWIFLASRHWTDLQEGCEGDGDYWELLRGTYKCRMLEQKTEGRFWTGYRFPKIFPGFNILAEGKLANVARFEKGAFAEAEQLLHELEAVDELETTPSLQLAIGNLAVGRKDKAVHHLRRAVDDGDFWTLYMDRLPFLAALKGYGAFEELKAELPAAYGLCLNP